MQGVKNKQSNFPQMPEKNSTLRFGADEDNKSEPFYRSELS